MRQVPREEGELAPRLAERRARLEARLDGERAIVAVLEEPLPWIGRERPRHRERHVEVGAHEDLHPREALGRDADDGEVPAVQADRPADDAGGAAELVLPEVGPEDRHGVAAGHPVLVLRKPRPSRGSTPRTRK
jgi:hypothetical protein